MKIELDFDQKIITVVSEVNMHELYDKMKELKLDPKEWKLQHNVFSWGAYPVYPPYPIIGLAEPYKSPSWEDFTTITCGTSSKYAPSFDIAGNSYSSN